MPPPPPPPPPPGRPWAAATGAAGGDGDGGSYGGDDDNDERGGGSHDDGVDAPWGARARACGVVPTAESDAVALPAEEGTLGALMEFLELLPKSLPPDPLPVPQGTPAPVPDAAASLSDGHGWA